MGELVHYIVACENSPGLTIAMLLTRITTHPDDTDKKALCHVKKN